MLAGDPRLIDELMQEMIGGAAWPAGQGALLLSLGLRPRDFRASANAEDQGQTMAPCCFIIHRAETAGRVATDASRLACKPGASA